MFKKFDCKFLGALFVLCGAFLGVLYMLFMFGDKFPHIDEWKFVPVKDDFLDYVFRFNNENLQVFTNSIFFGVEKFVGVWGVNKYISYGVYVLMLFMLYKVLSFGLDDNKKAFLLLLFLSFFSDFASESLLWVILSQTWFYFLFTFMGIKLGFFENKCYENMWFVLITVYLSGLSMNISLPICFSILYVAKNMLNSLNKKEDFFKSLVFLMLVFAGVFAFWHSMNNVYDTYICWDKLDSKEFYVWLFYFMLAPMSGMKLFNDNEVLILSLGIVLVSWMGFLFFRQIRDKNKQAVWAVIGVMLGGMLAITLFRNKHVLMLYEYATRYIIYGLCFMVAFWVACVIDDNRVVRKIGYGIGGVLLFFVLWGYHGDRFFETYKANYVNEKCIMNYYEKRRGQLIHLCTGKYWGNLAPKLIVFEKIYLKDKIK